MSKDEIRNCPACGGEMELITDITNRKPVYFYRCECDYQSAREMSKQEAIEAANHQPRIDKLEAENAELNKKNAELKQKLERIGYLIKMFNEANPRKLFFVDNFIKDLMIVLNNRS